MAEGRMVKLRPNAAPIGRNHQQAPIIPKHAPAFPQQAPGILRRFQPVHQQDAIKAQIRERQRVFFRQHGRGNTARGKARRAKLRGGKRNAARRFFAP